MIRIYLPPSSPLALSPDLRVEEVDEAAAQPQRGDVEVVVGVGEDAEDTEVVVRRVRVVQRVRRDGHLLDHHKVAEQDLCIALCCVVVRCVTLRSFARARVCVCRGNNSVD